MSSAPPPHPGSAWQQCHDQGSGYPYYWNTTTNQVRWDCPLEFRQWQISLAKPPPATLPPPQLVTNVKLATVIQPEVMRNSASPPSLPAVSVQSMASALVSGGYDSDSEEDESVDEKSEENKTELVTEAAEVEAQPDFIGPIIPKQSDPEAENDTIDDPVEPPPPGSDTEESEALLLKKLKEKSETLAQMGGDIDNAVREIIDPENIAKIENDLADDILSQIEAEKPPDYLGQQPSLPIAPAQSILPPQPSLPPQQTKPPLPLPRRPLQPSSMLQLACNYGHESDSDTEDPEPVRKAVNSKLLPVTGQLDSLGRIVFNQGGSGSGWQTEEQREALESYKAQSASEEQTNGVDESHPRDKYEAVNTGSRKRRLALPGGRFNKADQSEKEVQSKNDVKTEFKPMNFVKSSSIIPGTINEADKKDIEKKESTDVSSPSNEDPVQPPDVSTQATELVEKLEYFKVGEEKVSSLKTLAIKLETLYSAWSAGALSLPYLNIVLQNAKKKIEEAENSLDTPPWKAIWDRDKRIYTFKNELTGKEKNEKEVSLTPPPGSPPPLPSESQTQVLPPLPPPDAPPPALPPSSTDHQLQDMEIDDEPTVNITDELSNFYSEIQQSDPDFPPEKHAEEVKPAEEVNSSSSAPNSAPGSPAPPEIKKRKKVKVSNNIALKKKGVGDMLAKWQKINN